jgi:hypothetical protein
VIGSHGNISKYSVDKSLNNISGNGEQVNAKMKNFFMTPGITNDRKMMNQEDIFTQNKHK